MTDEVKYDPELPYALVRTQGESDRYPLGVVARTRTLEDVMELSNHYQKAYFEVVDTTPKPKIPEDANYIFVEDGDQSVFARREGIVNGEMHWLIPGGFIMEAELIEDYIGSQEVIVLVPKEDA